MNKSANAMVIKRRIIRSLAKRYSVLSRLGEGGNGIVFKIREISTGIYRVVKVLSPAAATIEQLKKEFQNEALKLAELSHPNLVSVIESYPKENPPYFIMEYIPGQSLEKESTSIAKEHPHGEWVHYLHQIYIQLADVLEYLHHRDKPLLHLDIKPENIKIDKDFRGNPKAVLLDFGLSRFAQKKIRGDKETTAFGTLSMWPQSYLAKIRRHTHTGRTVFEIDRNLLNPELDLHFLGRTIQNTLEIAKENDSSPQEMWESKHLSLYNYLNEFSRTLQIDHQNGRTPLSAREVSYRIRRVIYLEHRARMQFDRGFLRIPSANIANFGRQARALTDWPMFQRLRGINQLGFASMVFPGANHTRFEHSLGVFENALDVVDHLAGPHGDNKFRSLVSDEEIIATIIAALFHDIGHYPFTHQFRVEGQYPKHEVRSLEIIESDECVSIVTKFFSKDVYKALKNIFSYLVAEELGREERISRKREPKYYRLLKQILSGSVDVDKLDYINRDSIHAGVPYGRVVDRARLISSFRVWWDENGLPELVLSDKGRACAEALVFGRYLMFSEVYWNHCVRAYSAMLSAVLQECRENEIGKHIWDTDTKFLYWIQKHKDSSWFFRLIERRTPFRRAFVQQREGSQEDTSKKDERLFSNLERAASGDIDHMKAIREAVAGVLKITKYEKNEIIVDVPKKLVDVAGIRVLPEGSEKPISPGPVFKAIGQNFDGFARKARVFVHPKIIGGRSVTETNPKIKEVLLRRFAIY